jgi:hypothetical protein
MIMADDRCMRAVLYVGLYAIWYAVQPHNDDLFPDFDMCLLSTTWKHAVI